MVIIKKKLDLIYINTIVISIITAMVNEFYNESLKMIFCQSLCRINEYFLVKFFFFLINLILKMTLIKLNLCKGVLPVLFAIVATYLTHHIMIE